MVAIAGPPPTRRITPRHATLAAGRVLTRIYNRDYLGPDQYNHNGPRARFDHHDPGLPRHDIHHGVYYAADDLAGCVIEVFGDRGEIELMNYGVATVALKRELRLLDLNGDGAWEAGSVALTARPSAATQPLAVLIATTPLRPVRPARLRRRADEIRSASPGTLRAASPTHRRFSPRTTPRGREANVSEGSTSSRRLGK